jgi:hypothetical protein
VKTRPQFDTDYFLAVYELCGLLFRTRHGLVLGGLRVQRSALYNVEDKEPITCGDAFTVAEMAVGLLGARPVLRALANIKP